MIAWFRTNRFLRQALEDAHTELASCTIELASCAADLGIEKFANERLEHHLAQPCLACEVYQAERDEALNHAHKLEFDNTRFEWECEKWRAFYYASQSPMPGLDT